MIQQVVTVLESLEERAKIVGISSNNLDGCLDKVNRELDFLKISGVN